MFARALGFLLLAVSAAAVAVAGTFVSRLTVRAGSTALPVGLVLTLVATAALFHAGGSALGRYGALVPASVWLVGVGVAMWPGSGGDVLVSSDGLGLGFVLLGLAAAGWAVVRAWSADASVPRPPA